MENLMILLTPGSFALPEFYETVIQGVRARGWEMRALHLPTVGTQAGQGRDGARAPSMHEDAAFIAKEVEKYANKRKNVLLIAHSYSGVPATESTLGLRRSDRAKQGKPGGISRLAFMAAIVPASGASAADVLLASPASKLETDENGWMLHTDTPADAAHVFSDLPLEEGQNLLRRFPRHSARSFSDSLTHDGCQDVPISYLLCTRDKLFPLDLQKAAIKRIEQDANCSVDVTVMDVDHCPMVSAPEKTIEWIVSLAVKTSGEAKVI